MKPIVKYTGTVTIEPWFSDNSIKVAIITGVKDHPNLGNQRWVRTSEVLVYDEESGRVETLNTVYEKG